MSEEAKKTRAKSKEYPADTLEQAIAFVTKFKDYPIGKAIAYDAVAKELKVSTTTKSFRYMISSARQYGLISRAAGNTISLLEPANRLIRPTESEKKLQVLKTDCFSAPKIYRELISQYNGQSLPTASTLENVLINFHGILPNVAGKAAQTFLKNANELGVVVNGVLDTNSVQDAKVEESDNSQNLQQESNVIDNPHIQELTLAEGEFDAPLTVPLGEHRKAVLYMPMNTEKEDAEYVRSMIDLMFKKLYGVN